MQKIMKKFLYLVCATILLVNSIDLSAAARQPVILENKDVVSWLNADMLIKDFVLKSSTNFAIADVFSIPNSVIKPEETLIVIDIDGTVGLQVKARNDRSKRVFIPIKGASQFIKKWQSRATVLGLTARNFRISSFLNPGELGGAFAGNTPSDLEIIDIDYGTPVQHWNLQDFTSIPEAGYEKGVIYAGATSKGEVLQAFLNNNPQLAAHIKRIIFIDDNENHINTVKKFLNANSYDGLLALISGGADLNILVLIWEAGERAWQEAAQQGLLPEQISDAKKRALLVAIGQKLPTINQMLQNRGLPEKNEADVLNEIQTLDKQIEQTLEKYEDIKKRAGHPMFQPLNIHPASAHSIGSY